MAIVQHGDGALILRMIRASLGLMTRHHGDRLGTQRPAQPGEILHVKGNPAVPLAQTKVLAPSGWVSRYSMPSQVPQDCPRRWTRPNLSARRTASTSST